MNANNPGAGRLRRHPGEGRSVLQGQPGDRVVEGQRRRRRRKRRGRRDRNPAARTGADPRGQAGGELQSVEERCVRPVPSLSGVVSRPLRFVERRSRADVVTAPFYPLPMKAGNALFSPVVFWCRAAAGAAREPLLLKLLPVLFFFGHRF